MSAATERPAQHVPNAVLASLNYLGDMRERPLFHVHHRANDNLNLEPHTVAINEARGAHTSIECQGFCLLEHHSSENLESRRAVSCAYGMEMARLVRELTGARKVYAASMGVLRVVERSRSRTTVHHPVRFVHADCSAESATRSLAHRFRVRDELRPGCRYAIYHCWRSLTPSPQDAPLALCDCRTLQAQDCVVADTVLDFPGSRIGRTETVLLRYNAGHQWYYFRNMTPDEVVVFKDFDSSIGYPSGVPHTAFDDPTCPADAPARKSLDLQLLAIF